MHKDVIEAMKIATILVKSVLRYNLKYDGVTQIWVQGVLSSVRQ